RARPASADEGFGQTVCGHVGHPLLPFAQDTTQTDVRPHVRFLPGVILGREAKARGPPWTRQGHSPWNQPVGDYTSGLGSHPPIALVFTLKGVTRLVMCR